MPINYEGVGGGIPRKTAHIFAKNAAASDVTVFGSTLAQDTQYTTDIADIQNNAYEIGWRDAVISNKNYPLMGDMNGVLLTLSQQIAYLLQHGLSQWDSATEYYTYDIVNVNGVLYISTDDNNVNNDPTTLVKWAIYYDPRIGFANIDLSNLSAIGNNRLHALKGYEDAGELLTDSEGLADVAKYAHSTFDLSKFTVVGSPNITDDGIILPNWNVSNYASNTIVGNGSTNYEIHYRLLTNKGNFTSVHSYTQPLYLTNTGNKGWILEIYTETSNVINAYQAGFNYVSMIDNPASVLPYTDYIDIVIKNNGVSFTISTYKDDGTLLKTITSSTSGSELPIETLTYKTAGNGYFTTGTPLYSIDLEMYKVTVDGIPVFSGNQTGIDTIKPDNYAVVGSPDITDDGVASGFSSSGSRLEKSIDFTNMNTFTIEGEFNHPVNLSNGGRSQTIFSLYDTTLGSSRLILNNLYSGSATLKWNYPASSNTMAGDTTWLSYTQNATQSFKVDYDGTKIRLYLNGNLVITSADVDKTWLQSNYTLLLGNSNLNDNYNLNWMGSIDLNSFKIYVDGSLVYQPCLKIPYTLSKTGSKIVDSTYRDRVSDMYEQFGYAPYYTLNEGANFTLPQGELYGRFEDKWHIVNQNVNNSTSASSAGTTTAVNFAQYIENADNSTYECLFKYYVTTRSGTANVYYTVFDETNNITYLKVVIDSNSTSDTRPRGGQFTAILKPTDVLKLTIKGSYNLYTGSTEDSTEGITFLAYRKIRG